MSRIYEALQKAESERKLDRREREVDIPKQPASATMTRAVADPDEAVFATPRFAAASFVAEPYVEPPARRGGEGSLDLSKIPARPWAPSLQDLPALLERGPAVEQFRSLRSRTFELRDIGPLRPILVRSG